MNTLRLAAMAALALSFAIPAHAQSAKCGPRAEVVKVLTEKYHEVPVAIGTVDDKLIMEAYGSTAGTWTMLLTNTDGISCIISAGENWQFDTKAFDDAKKGPGA